jgi:hypothetical protein
MNIEDVLFPNNGKLIIKGEDVTATIIDAEIDPIDCDFNYDGTIKLNTEDYSHIHLSIENLYKMIELIQESEDYFKEKYSNL